MALEQLMAGGRPRYVQMQSEPSPSIISSFFSFRHNPPESTRMFDELPKATIIEVSRPDAGDISPILLSYTIEFRYKQGVVHRDVKPGTSFSLVRSVNKGYLIDFNLAMVKADMSENVSAESGQLDDPLVRKICVNGVCIETNTVKAKLDEGNIQEAEYALREGLSLNFEEA